MGRPAKAKKKTAAAKKKEMEELAQQEQEAADQDQFEFQKTCLEIRVKELENLNLGLQRKSEYLESQNDVYKAQLEDLKEEKEDLVAHLQRCYTEEKTNVKELEDRLYGTQQARLEERTKFEQRLDLKDKEIEKVRDTLGKKIMDLDSKLTALEDFRVQKENLTSEKEQLVKSLEDERSRFIRNYDEVENNLIRYREKIKNESVDMVKKMACDVQQAGKLCLTATVKSAISENIRLQDELEGTSKENVKLRAKLDKSESEFRAKKVTVEVTEEENRYLHKKCFQYRMMTHELLDRQLLLEKQLDSASEVENDLIDLKARHAICKTDEEIQGLIANELEKVVDEKLREETQFIIGETDNTVEVESIPDYNAEEIKRLQDAIVRMAIASKELSQADNPEEMEFLKGRFKLMLVKLYEIACDLPDLPQEIKQLLQISVPQVTSYISFK